MSSSENKTTIRQFWEEGYNNRNLNLMDQLLTSDYTTQTTFRSIEQRSTQPRIASSDPSPTAGS
jgi:hypothetical protein